MRYKLSTNVLVSTALRVVQSDGKLSVAGSSSLKAGVMSCAFVVIQSVGRLKGAMSPLRVQSEAPSGASRSTNKAPQHCMAEQHAALLHLTTRSTIEKQFQL